MAQPAKPKLTLKSYAAIAGVLVVIAGAKYLLAGGRLPLPGPSAPAALLSGEDLALQAKLAPLVLCLNRALPHFEGVEPQFLSTVQALSVPARPGRRSQPTYEGKIFNVTLRDEGGQESLACADGLDKASAMSPAIAGLDDTAKAIAVPLRAMIAPGAKWDTYIDQQTYLDDGFTAGRQLAATLSPLLAELSKGTDILRNRVAAESAAIRGRRLIAIEHTEGQSQRWHNEHLMIVARELVGPAMGHLHATAPDAATVQSAIDHLQAAFDAGTAYASAHAGDNPALTVWRGLAPPASDELREAKDLRRTLADPPPETPADREQRLETLQRNVGAKFDTLVEAYNQLHRDGA